MSLLSEAAKGFNEDIESYFTELFESFLKTMRFVWLALKGLIVLSLSPYLGTFLLSLYLWGERSWCEKLNLRQKILFWLIATPASIAHFTLSLVVVYHLEQ